MFGATLHRDFSDYRMNAHGTRLQNLWSMQYRFIPAHLGHGLVTRMGESYLDSSIEKANDLLGWKYSLISAIAYCGSVTHCNLPDNLEHLPSIKEFYKKWITWAKQNYEYCKFAVPIADDVADGVVDGIARVKKDKGQIFLFNSSPTFVRKRITLGSRLGFDTDKDFYLRLIYCERVELGVEPIIYRGAYKIGDTLDITLPPYGAVVFEVVDSSAGASIEEIPFVNHTVGEFRTADNERFNCQNHTYYDKVSLFTKVYFSQSVKDALKSAVTPNKLFILEKLDDWSEKGIPFNFTTSFPNRLLAYIPIQGVKLPRSIALLVNGKSVPVEAYRLKGCPILHYAFIEDYIVWDRENELELRFEGLAESSFMGLYFEFPDVNDGMLTVQNTVDEKPITTRVYGDSSLIIDSLLITPEPITDTDAEIIVKVKTNVPTKEIESVYFLHPTKPQVPRLRYDADENCWCGVFKTGRRSLNIFSNSKVCAWIKSKNGGIGPKKYANISITFLD